MTPKKEFFLKLQVKLLDIDADKLVCILNEKDARELGVFILDRIHVLNPQNQKAIHAVVDTAGSFVKKGEIGFFEDVAKVLEVKNNSFVKVAVDEKPKSVEFIRKKLDNKKLLPSELSEIVRDIKSNKLSDVETTAFVSAVYINGFDLKETVAMTKALVEHGKKIEFKFKPIVDKHSVGGTNGRTTMIIVPIIAASGLFIPKTSSRTITSASGTADAMEVLAQVSLSIEQIKKITKTIGGVIAWGGAVDLAPADDKIIKIEHPLSLDPEGQVIASVMAKKASVGAKFLVIDLPVGPHAKIRSKEAAQKIALKFLEVGKELGIKVQAILTDGQNPSGKAFGPALEAKYAMEVLEGKFFDNLAQKSVELAGALLELSGKKKHGEGVSAAKKILESGAALKKMREIIKAQGGSVFSSEQIEMADFKKTFFATKSGRVKKIHLERCVGIARTAGAPADKKAGLMLKVSAGEKVKKGEKLLEIFAQNQRKFLLAVQACKKNSPVEM